MSTKQRRVELKNCTYTDTGILYINRTPLESGYFHMWGVFQTPQTKRLSALFSVVERADNVKGFFM